MTSIDGRMMDEVDSIKVLNSVKKIHTKWKNMNNTEKLERISSYDCYTSDDYLLDGFYDGYTWALMLLNAHVNEAEKNTYTSEQYEPGTVIIKEITLDEIEDENHNHYLRDVLTDLESDDSQSNAKKDS